MRTADERHLTPDEIVDRVFPGDDRPAAIPAHLGACAACQAKVARLREAWLLDRGAVEGVVDALPVAYWDAQRASILARLEAGDEGGREGAPAVAPAGDVSPFPVPDRRGAFLRHPVLAAGSLAAALVLVVGLTVSRLRAPAPAGPDLAARTPAVAAPTSGDAADDELLLSIERTLSQEPAFASLVPEEAL